MRIAITGAQGFIGRNLQVRLKELGHLDPVLIPHDVKPEALPALLAGVDFVFHLAGVNRPLDPSDFTQGNHVFTRILCEAMAGLPTKPRIAYASSTQAALDNPYGRSKREAEDELLAYGEKTGTSVHVFRLTNVFGKWSRPNYNSAVATFCHNIARGEQITVKDPDAPLRLIYIDDVLRHFCALLDDPAAPSGLLQAGPEYDTTVGALADQIRAFQSSRESMVTERVGTGLTRALYATYVSFLPLPAFEYEVQRHADPRGVFVEMLKTPDCGQFGYFTAFPGITRGEHYHHTKTEKFLVIKGTASFGYRHILTNETYEIITRGGDGRIVETIPGWTHNVSNIGDDELVVMVWANEIFDRQKPDTIAQKVQQA
ncbi:UDP-2-acetamido-2,6-beta-L-arabino-hexul-4-ose reductase [Paucibacter sp. XJ19-41]|uniref:UDP-2-acetamido-2,6-beta-L-arabino-hexul-4-ose reductase n=1 Tax=Paucibacter sp. XJ19-41 TaxID=2927824 RepID=UPI002349A5CE|nr:NAD-dependent epimerase/dehydratase family protein [Paucibacter sp. XJ19-41]MDC6166166.1 NAD-dependent epimerase/dehydratase family protein [Paucibacter sp. XJ19-41]